MTPEEQYPSTDDCANMDEGQDLVLACMKNARKRVAENWTQGSYISYQGAVCAVGAVYAACGGFTADTIVSVTQHRCQSGSDLYQLIEGDLRDEAKQAIALLNAAAVELHPEAEEFGHWQGPLEWINQDWRSPDYDEDDYETDDEEDAVQAEILRIYDHAIEQRQAVAADT